jgi:hypothetical protein
MVISKLAPTIATLILVSNINLFSLKANAETTNDKWDLT